MRLFYMFFAASSAILLAQSAAVRVTHGGSYFRTQSNASWLVRVNGPAGASISVGLNPDPNFTVTRINAPSNWTCSVSSLVCSRPDIGSAVLEFLQVVGTVSANAPSSITNSATLTGWGNPMSSSVTGPVYGPARIVRWGLTNSNRSANQPTDFGYAANIHGFLHNIALRLDGTPVMWGSTLSNQQLNVPSTTQFITACGGSMHSAGITTDGRVLAWGSNQFGQTTGTPTDSGYVALACTDLGTYALTNRGQIVTWGSLRNTTDFPSGAAEFVGIASGYDSGVALRADGTVAQWGANNLGQRNNLPTTGGFTAIASTQYAPIVQRADGTLYQWGSSTNNPTNGIPTSPAAYFTSHWSIYASGTQFSDGSVLIWGDSSSIFTPYPTNAGYVFGSLQVGNGASVLLPIVSVAISSGNSQSALINSQFSNALSVLVTDATGNPAAGVNVTFNAPGSGASGTFAGSGNSVTIATNSSGIATAPAFTANGTVGQYNVAASVAGMPQTLFALTNSQPLAVSSILEGSNFPIPPMFTAGVNWVNVNYNQSVANGGDTGNFMLVGRNIDGQDPQTTSCTSIAPGDFDAGVSQANYFGASNYTQVVYTLVPNARFKVLVCPVNRVNPANSLRAAAGSSTLPDVVSSVAFASAPILAVTSFASNTLIATLNAAPISSTVTSASVKLLVGPISNPGCSSAGSVVAGSVSASANSIQFTPSAPLGGGTYHFVICGSIVRGGNGGLLAASSIGAAGVDFVSTFNVASSVAVNVPVGVGFTLNGVPYTGSQTVQLLPGTYSLTTASPQPMGAGTQAVFVSWSDNGAQTHDITVGSSALSITGTFKTQYQLTTSASPSNGGTVSPASGSFYDAGSSVPVSATANSGFVFSSWTGPVVSGTVTMDAPKSITANFAALQSVTINVPAGVSFTLNSVNYTGSQSVNLAPGTYTLATTSPQSLGAGTQAVFQSWSDSGAISHSISVASSPLTITGTFKTQYQLTTAASPTNGGTASPTTGAFFDAGTVVPVSASANSGFVFSSWTGPVVSGNVTMDAPKSITANFVALQGVTINVPAGVSFTLNGTPRTGSQTVSLAPGTYTLSTTSPQSLGAGIQAVFQSWSDSGAISHSITVGSSPLTITGTFKTQYQLTTSATAGGSVTPVSGSFYDAGSVVPVSASATPGYVFSSWTGPVVNNSVTMDAPKSITANFSQIVAAPNVTGQTTITRTSPVLNRLTGRFAQTVTVVNNGTALSSAALVIDALATGYAVYQPSGVTTAAAPLGSAYKELGPIAAGATVSIAVEFTRTGTATLTFTPRILGAGTR